MKAPLKKREQEAGLSMLEIEKLANDINAYLLKGNGATISDYLTIVNKTTPYELGSRMTGALKFEHSLEAFFPLEVLKILSKKYDCVSFSKFNKADHKFLKENVARGATWLSKRFYTTNEIVRIVGKRLGVEIFKEPRHEYTDKENEFIKNNVDKGLGWLANRLHKSRNAVRAKLGRFGLRTEWQGPELYTPEEDDFIKKNKSKGAKWISKRLEGRNTYSVKIRAKKINVKIQSFNNGKKVHQYSERDDRYIRKNAEMGSEWIAEKFNVKHLSVSGRANKIGVRLAVFKNGIQQHMYTKEEDNFIKANFDSGSKWVADYIGVSVRSVRDRSKKIGVKFTLIRKNMKVHLYSNEEDTLIRENAKKGTKWLADLLNTSRSSVRRRAKKISVEISMIRNGVESHRYTKEDDELIRNNFAKGKKWLAKKLGVSTMSVAHRGRGINIVLYTLRNGTFPHMYTKEDDTTIRENTHLGTLWLSYKLDVSTKSISQRALRIGVKVTPFDDLRRSENA